MLKRHEGQEGGGGGAGGGTTVAGLQQWYLQLVYLLPPVVQQVLGHCRTLCFWFIHAPLLSKVHQQPQLEPRKVHLCRPLTLGRRRLDSHSWLHLPHDACGGHLPGTVTEGGGGGKVIMVNTRRYT